MRMTIMCLECREMFETDMSRRGRTSRICSKACQMARIVRRLTERRRQTALKRYGPTMTLNCMECKREFQVILGRDGPPSQLCSERCRKDRVNRKRRQKKLPARVTCLECKKEFMVIVHKRGPNKELCSPKCWNKRRNRMHKERAGR